VAARIVHADGLIPPQRPHRTRHDPVCRPVATAYYVADPGAGDAHMGGLMGIEPQQLARLPDSAPN